MAAGPIIESTPIGAAFQRFGLSKLLIPAGIVTVGTVPTYLFYLTSLGNLIMKSNWIFSILYFQFYQYEAKNHCSGEICIPSSYNSLDTPLQNQTNNVKISIPFLQILKVNDFDCTIKMSFWISVEWMEPRWESSLLPIS